MQIRCIRVTESKHKILVGKPEMKKPLKRSRRRWKCIIQMGLKETIYEYTDWVHGAQEYVQWRPLENTVMGLRVPYQAERMFLCLLKKACPMEWFPLCEFVLIVGSLTSFTCRGSNLALHSGLWSVGGECESPVTEPSSHK
jgi:hypothetical protein